MLGLNNRLILNDKGIYNSMQHIYFRKSDSRSAFEEIHRILWNVNVAVFWRTRPRVCHDPAEPSANHVALFL